MINPTISCIMSVHNRSSQLENSIQSVLDQTYTDFEFLIIDDGSSENILEILEKFKKIDNRVKIFKNSQNIGLTKSLNRLISESTGIYIARQDADDISDKKRFETQINFLTKNNYDGCTTLARGLQSNKILRLKSSLFPVKILLKFKNPFIHGTLMLNRKVIQDIGSYNEYFYFAQDYKLFTDLVTKGYRVKIIKEVLYRINQENNISNNHKKEQQAYAKEVQKSYKIL